MGSVVYATEYHGTNIAIHHRAALHPPYMRHKSILIAIIITSSSLTGCLGEDSGGTDEIAELTEDLSLIHI